MRAPAPASNVNVSFLISVSSEWRPRRQRLTTSAVPVESRAGIDEIPPAEPEDGFEWPERSATAVQNFGNFIEMRIDLVGQFVELAPGFAKVRRPVRRLQQFPVLPLDEVHD